MSVGRSESKRGPPKKKRARRAKEANRLRQPRLLLFASLQLVILDGYAVPHELVAQANARDVI